MTHPLVARTRPLLPRAADWTSARPRRDLTAGLMVGLVALPLALGFGVSSGMGATAGLVTAVVAGAVAAVCGGSRVQVRTRSVLELPTTTSFAFFVVILPWEERFDASPGRAAWGRLDDCPEPRAWRAHLRAR